MNEILAESGLIDTTNINSFMITNQSTFDLITEFSLRLAKEIRDLESKWTPLIESAKANLKKVKDSANSELEPRKQADQYLSTLKASYKMQQDRVARIEQERLEKEANEKAENERCRLLEKAVNAKTPEKQEELLEKAEQVYTKPVFAEPIIQKRAIYEGGKTTWITDIEVLVTDPQLFCMCIGNGKVPTTVVKFKNLKSWVKTNAIKDGQIAGLSIKEIQREMKQI